jgi:hypothetical protein
MAKRRTTSLLLLLLPAFLFAADARAQGKGKAKGDKHSHGILQQGHAKRPKATIRRIDDAVDVTRLVLRDHGYELVRVEQRGDVRVVYYRRGNMGRGRGKGPIMYMVLRPASDRILVERAPSQLSVQINVRLGY